MRPTGVYGPGDKDYLEEFQMVKSGLGFTVGMIPQRLTFIYAADLARAVVKAAQSEAALGKPISLQMEMFGQTKSSSLC